MKRYAVAITLEKIDGNIRSSRLVLNQVSANNENEALGSGIAMNSISKLRVDNFNIALTLVQEISIPGE